jgi:hypothetical protein
MSDARIRSFVLDYLEEIGAQVREAGGVYTVEFPTGFRRRYGRERQITFDADHRRDHVELLEPGSPLLKSLVADARLWGGLGVVATSVHPPHTRVYTFLIETYSSARKRTAFLHAVVEPGADVAVRAGVPDLFEAPPEDAAKWGGDKEALRTGIEMVLPRVEEAARNLAAEALRESHDAFAKAMARVHDYFTGLHQDTFLEEARIRKRLGEIQSKLYFTEDGLRELKLQREADRLSTELHALKKRNTQAQEALQADRDKHAETLRRRHEPKLRIRLIAATLVRAPPPRQAPLPAQNTAE